MNSTLSIDVSKSWYAQTVECQVTPKTNGPVSTGSHAIWNDPSGNAFYIFGGLVYYGYAKERGITTDGIWKFTVDGQGGGTWAKQRPSNFDQLETISLTDGAAYADTSGSSGGIGVSIGGVYNNETDPRQDYAWRWTNTMTVYDMKTKTISSYDMSQVIRPTGYLWHGRAQFVPQFSPNGLIFLLGGKTFPRQLLPGERVQVDGTGLHFDNITFFDPESRRWRWQSARGNIPPDRNSHCLVGVASPAGTYEM